MEKQRCEEARRRKEVRRSEKRKREKKEDAGPRKGRRVAIHCVFPMICGSGGSKGRLAKAAGAEPAGQMRDEKLHAVVARSTFPSQKCKKLRGSDHFWTVRCRFAWQAQGIVHLVKSEQNVRVSQQFGLQLQRQRQLHYTTLHYTTLHCTALHYTTLHALHYTTLD